MANEITGEEKKRATMQKVERSVNGVCGAERAGLVTGKVLAKDGNHWASFVYQ